MNELIFYIYSLSFCKGYKMKNIVFCLLLIIISFQTTCFAVEYNSSININNGKMTYNILHQEKYYCPNNENNPSDAEIYSPQDDCSIWNNDFWQKYGNGVYESCLNKQKELQKRVDKGLCDKITVEKHNENGTICEFEVTQKYKKVINSTCINTNLENIFDNKDNIE